MPECTVDRLSSLLTTLRELPGIEIVAGCGGHEEPGAMVPEEGFAIVLHVDVLDGGWRSLGIIAAACDVCEAAQLYVESVCHDCGGPNFELSGFDGQDPDELDAAICAEAAKL